MTVCCLMLSLQVQGKLITATSNMSYRICMKDLERALSIYANYAPSIASDRDLLCHLCARYV